MRSQKIFQPFGSKDEQDQGLCQNDDPSGKGGKRHQAFSDGSHDFIGIGKDADGDGDGTDEEKLLYGGNMESADCEIGEGGDGNEHADDVCHVVCAQRISAERAGQNHGGAGISVAFKQVDFQRSEQEFRHEIKDGGECCRQQRASDPSAGDFYDGIDVGDGIGEPVPPDNGADDGLADRNGQAQFNHAVDGKGGGKSGDKRSADGIDRSQASQGICGADAADDGAQSNKDTANDGCGFKFDHSGSDGGAKDVCRVVGAQRPAQKQAAA